MMAIILPLFILVLLTILIFTLSRKKKIEKGGITTSNRLIRFIDGLLDFIWIIQWIGIVATIIMSIYTFFVSPRFTTDINKIPVTISSEHQGLLKLDKNRANQIEIDDISGEVTVKNPLPASIFGYNLFFLFVKFILLISILYSLRKIVKTLVAGDPFIEQNGKRLRTIAFCTMTFAALDLIYHLIATLWVTEKMSIEGIHFDYRISIRLEYVLLGLLILVIAEVFRIGARMREDQTLTI